MVASTTIVNLNHGLNPHGEHVNLPIFVAILIMTSYFIFKLTIGRVQEVPKTKWSSWQFDSLRSNHLSI